MPIYEFKCLGCGRVVSFLAKSITADADPDCPHCGHGEMQRVFGGFAIGKSRADSLGESGGMEPDMGDLPDLDALDEEDPRSLGRFIREAAQQTGEELDPEMDEICSRLEAGEDPEKIEDDLGDVLDGGMGEGGSGGDELYDL
jgi:putative FmdB family regulatory protein